MKITSAGRKIASVSLSGEAAILVTGAIEAALIVGLISAMTGDALQDDIALTILGLRRRGQDILSGNTTARPGNAQTRGRNVATKVK